MTVGCVSLEQYGSRLCIPRADVMDLQLYFRFQRVVQLDKERPSTLSPHPGASGKVASCAAAHRSPRQPMSAARPDQAFVAGGSPWAGEGILVDYPGYIWTPTPFTSPTADIIPPVVNQLLLLLQLQVDD